jgi:predicted type IV restriction endonuclease
MTFVIMASLRSRGGRGGLGVTDGSNPATSRKSASKKMPQWEAKARDRLKTAVRKFHKPLSDMIAKDANETDTRLLVTDFICDGLGFDKYEDLDTEYRVRGEFADYGIRLDGDLVAFVEVKRVNTKLAQKHLRQVEMYAVNEGVEWIMLTNGSHWQVYHLTGGLPVQVDLALEMNLLGDEPVRDKVDNFFYITRESLKRDQISQVWKATLATSPSSLAHTVLSESVVDAIRKELRRTTGHKIEPAEITEILRNTVIRKDCLEQ